MLVTNFPIFTTSLTVAAWSNHVGPVTNLDRAFIASNGGNYACRFSYTSGTRQTFGSAMVPGLPVR